MGKKIVLILDRSYSVRYMKSETFEIIVVCLSSQRRKQLENQGFNIVGCFEDEYPEIPISEIPDNYLTHSFDSDRLLLHYDYEKRLEILGKEINFWSTIYDTYHPNCIVNEIVTIEFMEVMVIEASKRNIPYFRWGGLPFAPLDIWLVNHPYNSLMGDDYWNSINENENDIKKAIRYIQEIRINHQRPDYILQSKKSKYEILLNKIKASGNLIDIFVNHYINSIKGKFQYEDYFYLRLQKFQNAVKLIFTNKKYDKFELNENYDYFFYPLHYEPEAAVEYAGYYYNNQLMMIERIAHFLKVGQKLIVKEHPLKKGVLLSSKYQELKKRYSNLIFLPSTISAYEIYPHIKCIITLNGTAGFESWVCRRPVIVFGDVFYKDFPGVIACDSFKKLYEVIRNDQYQIADDEMITCYLAKLWHQLVSLTPYGKGSNNEDSLMNMTKQVECLLLKGFN